MKRALIVIDVQNQYFQGDMKVVYPTDSFANIQEAMDLAAEHNIPIIVVQHTCEWGENFIKGTDNWELHEEISKRPYEYLIEKFKPSSFCGTSLEEILQKEGVDTITIAGYMTQMCCDSTARDGFHKGYNVEFLRDATGTINIINQFGTITGKELHEATIMAQSYGLSQIMTLAEWKEAIK